MMIIFAIENLKKALVFFAIGALYRIQFQLCLENRAGSQDNIKKNTPPGTSMIDILGGNFASSRADSVRYFAPDGFCCPNNRPMIPLTIFSWVLLPVPKPSLKTESMAP